MVGGVITGPAATSEPCVSLSPHTALQNPGCCHQHRLPVDFIMAVAVEEQQVVVSAVVLVTVPVMHFQHLAIHKT